MAKLEQYKEKFKEYEGKELTTKYMIDNMDLTSYYIGLLTKEGVLEKVSRGIYKVNKLKKSKKNIITNDKNNNPKRKKSNFEKFRDFILAGNYEEAYDALVKSVEENKDNHNYDNHYRMYFILLTKVLKLKGSKKILDYDYDDILLEFYDPTRSEYFESYIQFREAVLSEKYEEAYEYLKVYSEKELSRHKQNKISTILSKKLLEQINIMENNKRKTSAKFNEIYKLVFDKKYEETLEVLREIMPLINTPKTQNIVSYIMELCQTVIDFKNDESLILPKKKQYDFKGDESATKVFLITLKNKDYKTAKSYADKCCQLNKNSFFIIAKMLLEDLLHCNKMHEINLLEPNEIQKMRIKTNKDDIEATRHFNRFLWAMQHLDFEEAYKEIKLNLSYSVKTYTNIYKSSYNIYLLLKQLKNMKENKLPIEELDYVYLSTDSDKFNLNLAIHQEDWISAQKYFSRIEIGDSLTLESTDLLLKAIFRQDKINRGIELTEEDELKPLSNHMKITDEEPQKVVDCKRNVIIKDEEDTLDEVVSEEIEKESTDTAILIVDDSKQEILESIKNLALNYKTLYELIKNREFEEAYALIKREEENGYSIENIEKNEKTSVEVIMNPTTCKEAGCVDDDVKEENKEECAKEATKSSIDVEPKQTELSEKELHKQEVLENIKDLELNYDTLYELIFNRKYEEALYLIEREENKEENLNRLYFNTKRLVSQYLHIINGTFREIDKKPIDFTQNCFKIFFAAINNRDYFLAFEYVDECIEYTREPWEMKLFKLILEDICSELTKIEDEKHEKEEEARKKQEAKEQIEIINKKLLNLSNKSEFMDQDVRECYDLLLKKVEMSKDNHLICHKDELVLGAAEATIMALNKGLNDYHFAQLGNNLEEVDDSEVKYSIGTANKKVGDTFYDALSCGDLLTVEQLLSTQNWDNFRDKLNNTNLRLLKNLLLYMREHMSIISDKNGETPMPKSTPELIAQVEKQAYELLTDKDKAIADKIRLLKELGALIKHQKYSEALGAILESDIDISKDEALIDITKDIISERTLIKFDAHTIFDEFNEALNNGDTKKAYEKLIEYSSFITSKSIDRDLTYHRKRLDILEKDLKQPNYEEKERIYNKALAMFYNKRKNVNYDEVIELLNKYIELDKDINNKGYILRAQAYAKTKRVKEAKKDYKKALEIAINPTALYALGKYAYEESDYERTIHYLEQYQAIRPFKSANISRMLATSYNSTGRKEKAAPYNKHLKHLAYLK